MKRIVHVLLVGLLCLGGCFNSDNTQAIAQEAYRGYYKAIEDNTRWSSSSSFYSVSGEMTQLPSGEHRYYLIFDEPQVAMYDIAILAVEDDKSFAEANKMMPSIGVFETNTFHMIPYQANSESGYVKGLVISGETENDELRLNILVEWYDKTHEIQTREFLEYRLNSSGLYPFETSGQVVENETVEEESEEPSEEGDQG